MAGSPGWVIGGPEFYLPDVAAPADGRFRKDTLGIVPNVTRVFIDSKERLAFYFEVYNNQPKHPIAQVVVDISQRREQRRFVDTVAIGPDRPVMPVLYSSQLPEFHSGQARMILQAIDADGKILGEPVESVFLLEWSLYTMVESDWTRTVDMLVHIATHAELETLRAAPPEKRLEAFEAFWKSKDPSPETEENEWRDEYYRRVRFANRQYSNPFQPGWRTDFGMVYIKYGEPDEVERFPFEIGQKPHEIWYYYAQRREFTFVDVRGNGEYELQYPYDGIIR
jgi:GWxTD domain-containing protein